MDTEMFEHIDLMHMRRAGNDSHGGKSTVIMYNSSGLY